MKIQSSQMHAVQLMMLGIGEAAKGALLRSIGWQLEIRGQGHCSVFI